MPHGDKLAKIIQVIIVILALTIAVLVFFFIRQYSTLQREKILNARELWISTAVKSRGAPAPSDVNFVQSWMTFDYIDQLFHLPPNYLASKLSIADPNYPRITISGYARHNKLNTVSVLGGIDQAIIEYLAQATSTPPAAQR